MTRHVCGTCRHFKAAGFDNMGWCTNPKRRERSDSLIFVRSLELPCRNDWASDLWQSKEGAPALADATVAAPEAPISLTDIRFLASRRSAASEAIAAEAAAALGEDVVVGETTALPDGEDARHREDAKGSLRRAHEELRLRNRERRPGLAPESTYGEFSRPEDSPPVIASSATGGNRPVSFSPPMPAPSVSRTGEVPPVTVGELGRPDRRITTLASDADVFGTIPEPDKDFDLPLITTAKTKRLVGRAGFDDDGGLVPWAPERATAEADAPRVRTAGPQTAGVSEATVIRAQAVEPPPPTARERSPWPPEPALERDPEPIEPIRPPRRPPVERLDRSVDRRVAAAVEEILNPDRSARREPPAPEIDAYEIAERDDRATAELAFERDDRVRTRPTIDDLSAEPDEPERDVWSTIPRMCRTCRDFRPAENGDRGWCTNKWAFSHRRMVDADELPCETTIGGWWLPSDDLWMSDLDVSAHGQPTPLLDQWQAAARAARGDFEPALPVPRRQRS